MRIVVATQGNKGLDDLVSPVFGRAYSFTVVDVKDGQIVSVKTYPNEAAFGFRGVGVRASQFVVSLGADVVVSGNFGPNAQMLLQQSGIKTEIVPPGTTVRDVVARFASLHEVKQPSMPEVRRIQGYEAKFDFKSKEDLEFEKKMLELEKSMIEERIKYIEKKIREMESDNE